MNFVITNAIELFRKPLTEEEIRDWAKTMWEAAKMNIKSFGHLRPAFLVLSHDHKNPGQGLMLTIDAVDFLKDEESKDRASLMMPVYLAAVGAYAILQLSEAWATLPGSREELDRLLEQYGSVANLPDKREILMGNLEMEPTLSSTHYTAEIHRNGGISLLNERIEIVPQSGGRISGWLR